MLSSLKLIVHSPVEILGFEDPGTGTETPLIHTVSMWAHGLKLQQNGPEQTAQKGGANLPLWKLEAEWTSIDGITRRRNDSPKLNDYLNPLKNMIKTKLVFSAHSNTSWLWCRDALHGQGTTAQALLKALGCLLSGLNKSNTTLHGVKNTQCNLPLV